MKNLEFNLLEIAQINYCVTTERNLMQKSYNDMMSLRPDSNYDFMQKQISNYNDILDKIKTFAENYGK